MPKYIQRPKEIIAVKYDGTSDSYKNILREVDRYQGRIKRHIDATVFVKCFDSSLKIAKTNDYVIQLPDGSLNVTNEYDFEREYMYIGTTDVEELSVLFNGG